MISERGYTANLPGGLAECISARRGMTESQWAHLESAAQIIGGTIIAQIILWAFGFPMHEALALNFAFIGASYIRQYVIRRSFAAWRNQGRHQIIIKSDATVI